MLSRNHRGKLCLHLPITSTSVIPKELSMNAAKLSQDICPQSGAMLGSGWPLTTICELYTESWAHLLGSGLL